MVTLLIDGEPVDDVPEAALPDCEACEKPELDPSNREAVALFNHCHSQQTFNSFTGHRLGLRMEAVVACLDEMEAEGDLEDRARAFRRVWLIDQVVNDHSNAQIEQKQSASSPP